MHPSILFRWKKSRCSDEPVAAEASCCAPRSSSQAEGECCDSTGCCSTDTPRESLEMSSDCGDSGFDGSYFGVKRPLRFLTYKLGLNEEQVARLAGIIDQLKTERAQAAVDDRRTLTAFAEAMEAESFRTDKADEGGRLRVASAERLRTAVNKALQEIHQLLNEEQRAKLAYLIRTGNLVF